MHRSRTGFSLLETLVAAALLAFAAGALLHHLAFTFQHYRTAAEDWQAALQLWNRTARWRAGLETVSAPAVTPGGLPLKRVEFRVESAGRELVWEVLHVHP